VVSRVNSGAGNAGPEGQDNRPASACPLSSAPKPDIQKAERIILRVIAHLFLFAPNSTTKRTNWDPALWRPGRLVERPPACAQAHLGQEKLPCGWHTIGYHGHPKPCGAPESPLHISCHCPWPVRVPCTDSLPREGSWMPRYLYPSASSQDSSLSNLHHHLLASHPALPLSPILPSPSFSLPPPLLPPNLAPPR
jgi:hypothetical protein